LEQEEGASSPPLKPVKAKGKGKRAKKQLLKNLDDI
jgi:hypothetical protein